MYRQTYKLKTFEVSKNRWGYKFIVVDQARCTITIDSKYEYTTQKSAANAAWKYYYKYFNEWGS